MAQLWGKGEENWGFTFNGYTLSLVRWKFWRWVGIGVTYGMNVLNAVQCVFNNGGLGQFHVVFV